MDINNIYFSNQKFDGKKLKTKLSEIGQIAGRAGRYMNDEIWCNRRSSKHKY